MKMRENLSIRFRKAGLSFLIALTLATFILEDVSYGKYYPYADPKCSAYHVYRTLIDVKDIVGSEILIMGSSTGVSKQGDFRDPLFNGSSDFDLRIIAKPGDTTEILYKKWLDGRRMLRNRILAYDHWGGKGNKAVFNLLRNIQFHPPDELLKGCTNTEEVARRLKRLGELYNNGNTVVPELYHSERPMTETDINRTIDAIYGGDATAERKTIEATRGYLIKMDTKRIYQKPIGDLVVGEPYPTFTLNGQIKNADSWLQHAEDAMKRNDVDLMKKNIQRARHNLRKSASMYNSEHGKGKRLVPLNQWEVTTNSLDELTSLFMETKFRQRMMENLQKARAAGNSKEIKLIERLL
jgi:hypothetical protein